MTPGEKRERHREAQRKYQSTHKAEAAAYAKAAYKIRKKKIRAMQKAWIARNIVRLRAKRHARYLERREEVLARMAAERAADPDAINASKCAWYAVNKDRVNAERRAARAKEQAL